jgi:hypothetical protein
MALSLRQLLRPRYHPLASRASDAGGERVLRRPSCYDHLQSRCTSERHLDRDVELIYRNRSNTHDQRFGFYIEVCQSSFIPISIINLPLRKFVTSTKGDWSASRVSSRLPRPVLLFGQHPSEKAGSSDRLYAPLDCLNSI